jgi:hypothetical protein
VGRRPDEVTRIARTALSNSRSASICSSIVNFHAEVGQFGSSAPRSHDQAVRLQQ